jgi:hypothetical protein
MAEAAVLALASVIASKLDLTGVNFLSNSEQLVHFLSSQDLFNPPVWRIKPFIKVFSNNATATLPQYPGSTRYTEVLLGRHFRKQHIMFRW